MILCSAVVRLSECELELELECEFEPDSTNESTFSCSLIKC